MHCYFINFQNIYFITHIFLNSMNCKEFYYGLSALILFIIFQMRPEWISLLIGSQGIYRSRYLIR